MIAIVTNVDADHMATYGNDFDRLRGAFLEFLHHLPFYGLAVMCIDDDEVRGLLPQVTRRVITYGTRPEADLRAENVHPSGNQTRFDVVRPAGEPFAVTLNMPGRHNVLNALAAIAVALELEVPVAAIQYALENFQGIGRRFQVRDCGKDMMVVDDYGHHPRELAATIAAAREGWPERRLVLAFQPHRYSRTRDSFEDFVAVLSTVDALVLTEVYAAGEAPIPGADGRALSRAVRTRGQVDPVFVETPAELPELLVGMAQPGDVILVMGAGDIGAVAAALPEVLDR
jgi:UDP-N-acetylmuramate--alanine ligase